MTVTSLYTPPHFRPLPGSRPPVPPLPHRIPPACTPHSPTNYVRDREAENGTPHTRIHSPTDRTTLNIGRVRSPTISRPRD